MGFGSRSENGVGANEFRESLLSQGLITLSHHVHGLALGSTSKVCMWLSEPDTDFLNSSKGVHWVSENQDLIHAAVDRALSSQQAAAQEHVGAGGPASIDSDGHLTEDLFQASSTSRTQKTQTTIDVEKTQ